MHTLDEQLHVAELGVLAMAARAVLARAIADEPSVLSLRLTATLDGRTSSVDVELVGGEGAIAGFAL